MSKVQQRIDELRRQINHHNYKYYVDAHPENGRRDVREQHRRIHAVAANRLQRHLGTELR